MSSTHMSRDTSERKRQAKEEYSYNEERTENRQIKTAPSIRTEERRENRSI